MIGHKLPNKTKNATVAEPKFFHQLNKPLIDVGEIERRSKGAGINGFQFFH
jgi:hypothetical protein